MTLFNYSIVFVALLANRLAFAQDSGIWSPGLWSHCSVPCGGPSTGFRTRTWICTGVKSCIEHPLTGGSQKYVPGSTVTQTNECPNIHQSCLGSWSDWRQWGPCSISCGKEGSGVQRRARVCSPNGINECNKGNIGFVPAGAAELNEKRCPPKDIPCTDDIEI